MIVGIVQARMSSTRLPGKVMLPLLGKPMLGFMLDRVKRARSLDRLLVATSKDPSDDAIRRYCVEAGVACFSGSLDDVLDRFHQALEPLGAEHVVRLTGDCPLIDPAIIDAAVALHVADGNDVTSNSPPPGSQESPFFPDGMDVEIFRTSSLAVAWKEAFLPSEREHLGAFFHAHPKRFRMGFLRGERDLSSLRLTVDHADDLELVTRVAEALMPTNPAFTLEDVAVWLEAHPDVRSINSGHVRNEGYLKSLRENDAVSGRR